MVAVILLAATSVAATRPVAAAPGPVGGGAPATTGTVSGTLRYANSSLFVRNGYRVQLTALLFAFADTNLGAFSIANVPAGSYTLRVFDGATELTQVPVTVADGGTTSVDPTLSLAGPLGAVHVTATDLSTGLSPSSGLVGLFDGLTPIAGVGIAGPGPVDLVGIPPGSYTVRLIGAGYTVLASGSVVVDAGATAEVDLSYAVPVYGAVDGSISAVGSDAFIGGATVTLSRPAGTLTATTDLVGRFSFAQVPVGTYDLAVERDAVVLATTTVTVAASATTTVALSFALPAMGDLHGTVHDQTTGDPVVGAAVALLTDPGGRIDAGATTDATGAFAWHGLPPGTYRMVTRTAGDLRLLDDRTVTVVAGQDTAVDLMVAFTPPPGSVHGAVRAGDVAVVGATVRIDAVGGSGATATTTTGSLGAYQLGPLPPGSYTQTVRRDGQDLASVPVTITSSVDQLLDVSVTLPAVGGVAGTITVADAEGPTPQPGLLVGLVTAVDHLLVTGTTTGADGLFSLTGLPPGAYELWVGQPATFTLLVTVTADHITDASLVLALPHLVGATGDVNVAPGGPGEAPVVAVEAGAGGAVAITLEATCADGSEPITVELLVDGVAFPTTDGPGPHQHTGTVGLVALAGAHLAGRVTCADLTVTAPLTQITVYDPEGHVTDADTHLPIAGATVTLHQVPGWTPRTGPDDSAPETCESAASRPPGAPWSQVPPSDPGASVVAGDVGIDPAMNPLRTPSTGAYGWAVPSGCWFVTVTAPGYRPGTSALVGAPPAVDDLDVALDPLGAPGAPTAVTGSAARHAVAVQWTAPADDGGSPITGYVVHAIGPGGAPAGSCAWTSGPLACTVGGLHAGPAYTFTVTATNDVGSTESAASDPVTPTGGDLFHALPAPTRILDSRPAPETVGPYTTPWTAGLVRDVQVAGVGGVPADATAVVANVTVTGTTAPSFLTLWPKGTDRPTASNLNWPAGQTIPNAVTVRVGDGGAIDVFDNAGSVHVIIDVVGWYDEADAGGGFTAVAPARVLDSRPAPETVGPYATPWSAGTDRDVVVAGVGGVPADAQAVVANVTVTGTTAESFLTLYPDSETRPTASSLNWPAGRTIANAVTVRVGDGGRIRAFNNAGSAHVIVDVVGWFGDGHGDAFHPVSPTRIQDSRPPPEQVGAYATPWGPGAGGPSTRTVAVGTGGVVPAGAHAVLANVTVTATTAESFLTVWGTGADRPVASNLNWPAGTTIANAVAVGVGGDGTVSVFDNAGSAHVIADVAGWYG